MLLKEVAKLVEMARPAKICPDCGKSMAGNHFWYKGGWKCKKANRKQDGDAKNDKKKPEAKKEPAKKEDPKKASRSQNDENDHEGVVKGLEREADEDKDADVAAAERAEKGAKKKVKPGETISAAEMKDVDADDEAEARKQINSLFPKASAEHKTRALNIWKARHKKKD